jgi:hypothetical protein
LAYFAGRRRAEHEIRFSQIYQRRAEVIAHLNGALFDVEQSVTELTNLYESAGEPTKGERLREAGERLVELRSYYHRNSVWLDDDISERIEKFVDEIWGMIREFSLIWRALALSGTGEDRSEAKRRAREEGWEEAYKQTFGGESTTIGWLKLDNRVKEEVPALRQELRAAFREVMGTIEAPKRPPRESPHPWQAGW